LHFAFQTQEYLIKKDGGVPVNKQQAMVYEQQNGRCKFRNSFAFYLSLKRKRDAQTSL
jgi:hypothetical protein